MNTIWFPDRKLIRPSSHLINRVHSDFEEHADHYRRHDISYAQITPGLFRSRIMSAQLTGLDIYISYVNQSLVALVGAPSDRFTFSMVLEARTAFRFHGEEQERDVIRVYPSNGEIVEVSAVDGIILVLSVDSETLLACPALVPDLAERLHNLGPTGAAIRSKMLALRLAQLQQDIFETTLKPCSEEEIGILSKLVLHQLSISLTMSWLVGDEIDIPGETPVFLRFRDVRDVLLDLIEQEQQAVFDIKASSELEHLGSKRSIEMAFKQTVGMGPLQYWRLLRLHNVRRKLLQLGRMQQAIGDIAAEEGVWDQSKFGRYYFRLFGERPSDTRKRLDPDVLSRFRPQAVSCLTRQ